MFEVGVGKARLVLDKVLHLVPVVCLERFVLQQFQITLVELNILQVLQVARLEQTFSRSPLNGVTQLEVAHALLLHAFDAYSFQCRLELEGEPM